MLIAMLILSYLIGSIPTGLIVGKKLWNKDLRRYGSGNIGATNAHRVLGSKGGALVFLLDFFKGEIAVGGYRYSRRYDDLRYVRNNRQYV